MINPPPPNYVSPRTDQSTRHGRITIPTARFKRMWKRFLRSIAAQIRAAINPLKYILIRRYSGSGNSWYYTRVRPGYVGD